MIKRRLSCSSLTLLVLYTSTGQAREMFNPHALEIGHPGQPRVDLSAFAEAGGQLPGIYRVAVLINGERQGETQDIAFVAGQNNTLAAQITPAMLQRWGVKLEAFPSLMALPLNQPLDDIGKFIPMASSELWFNKLQLNVSLPQSAMRLSARDYIDPAEWDEGVPAALLNYSVSGSRTQRDGESGAEESHYANLQSGFNVGPWRLRSYSTWSKSESSGNQWDAVNTWLQRDITSLKGQLTLGDSYTPSDVFDSVQFRGAQLASDDNMLPDSLRGFAPIVRGIAQSSAQVTIKQNGYTIYQTYVAPGAFTINDLYPTSGSGDLTVTIKEADGSERTFVQPFSAVPIMQREGRLKYALAAGRYRSSEGSDEPAFGQVTAIYGLPKAVTLYGGTLYANNYRAGAAGGGFGFGSLGSLSADVTLARTRLDDAEIDSGQSYRIQYSKDIQATETRFTLAAWRYSTAGFYTFQEANDMSMDSDDNGLTFGNKRQKIQLDLTQGVGSSGSLFISGYQQRYWHQEGEERTVSAGWNGSLAGINYSLIWSYSDYPGNSQPTDQQLAFNIQVPLSRFLSGASANHAWASYSMNTAKQSNTRQQVGLNGSLLEDNNLSYSIQQSDTNHNVGRSGSINADYKGSYGELNGGYSHDANSQQVNYGLKGGVVAHPHGITLSQPLGESLAIVKAPGAGGTKVQNTTGVATDWRGYAVVPYVTPYRKNRIALDTSTLGDEVDIDTAVRSVTPTQGAVVMAEFNTRVGRRVLMTLLYRGLPVPFGAQAQLHGGSSGIVGNGGQVYLTGVPDKGEITVSWNGARQCTVHYQLPESADNSPVMVVQQECHI